jgi:hypothetical protein
MKFYTSNPDLESRASRAFKLFSLYFTDGDPNQKRKGTSSY